MSGSKIDPVTGLMMPDPVPLEVIFFTCLDAFPAQGVDDVPEHVSDVKYVADNEKRVAFVSTPSHGYFVLATNFNAQDVIGVIIGEEDCGVEDKWVRTLRWSSAYEP